MSQGLKISKPGFDVSSAAIKDLTFDSTTDGSFKVHNIYTISVDTSSVTEVSQAHGLGYVPAFFAICASPTVGYTTVVPFLNPAFAMLKVYADSTNITARAIVAPTGPTEVFKVVVFKEKLI